MSTTTDHAAATITDRNRAAVQKIKEAVAARYGFTVADLDSRAKQAQLALARHVAMWLTRKLIVTPKPWGKAGEYVPISTAAIAVLFGRDDHNSSRFAIARIERDRGTDAEFLRTTDDLLANLWAPESRAHGAPLLKPAGKLL